jgi:predicted dehydrogenase
MTQQAIKRGGIVGCGFFAGIQMEAWNRMGDVTQIVAAADIDSTRAREFCLKHGIPSAYAGYHDMLANEQLDFVDIVARPAQHAEVVDAAADRGVAILCQKPLATTYEGAASIVEYAEKHGVRFMANENWRWQPWHREIQRLLAASAVGRPFYFAFRHRQRDGLGDTPYSHQPYFVELPRFLTLETLIHYLDTARFLFGKLEVTASRMARVNPKIAGEDLSIILLAGKDGLTGMVDGNRCAAADVDGPAMGQGIIEGDQGVITWDGAGRIFLRDGADERREHAYSIPQTGYRGDSCYAAQRHFVECLASGAPFETSGRDYLETTKLVFDAYRLAEIAGSRPI